MRIAIISDSQGPAPMAGGHGLGRVVYNLAEGLIKRGHDITVFGTKGSYCSGRTIAPIEPGVPELEAVLADYALREHKRQPFDVIYDHGHVHVLSSLFPDLPVVNQYQDKWQPYQRCPVLSSYGQRDLMTADDPRFADARVLHNGHDAHQFIPSYRADDDPEYVVYMGAVIWYKQPMLAIEAAARARIKLVMCGNMTGGPHWLFENGETPYQGNTQYLGPVASEKRNEIMRGALCVLQLGHTEAGPMINIEAGLLGTPLVAWPRGGSLDYIKDCENGVFVDVSIEDKVDAVVEAIQKVRGIPRKRVRDSVVGYWGNLDRCASEAERHLMDAAGGLVW